ncbi:2-isopropylmalate synthase [Vitreoscilla massiliensis]|uniref:2-isopropylmalate synthase n=1 Tax=Vitreoscilla massiliensis TaxID=1689272 RepID=A0ABY4E0E6_9NEIS|nr:2-isopropylmalate synthase [Vitreoscilla massiliensis]UOO88275.1 2-isopropylmalate synthase [Vitreoscilla massiliensis]
MMHTHPEHKYAPYPVLERPQRRWPNQVLSQAPRWCSTDLRDGNQALAQPMDGASKAEYFQYLVEIGFKEIEVAFPAASSTDYDFVRYLIEGQHIPDDVSIQVITQARPELIERTLQSLLGAKQAIVHVYNATAPVFREQVFGMDKHEVIALAVAAVTQIKTWCDAHPETQWTLQYSPETFCMTELDFSIAICQAVQEVWQASAARPLILNLPATVEVNTPNVYADQIEAMIDALAIDAHTTISLHPHNDRGTGVAAAELAMLAGATRVEGCLFGNGERTGNVDLVTLALNLYSQGIHPQLDFSNMRKAVAMAEKMTALPVHPRHPYAGELVFTAFSGSHQDAIKKGFAWREMRPVNLWQVPYLPLDPQDVGATYEAVIRVNSQSGKSGAAWILQQNHGLILPAYVQKHFSQCVQAHTEQHGQEISIAAIWQLFRQQYGLHAVPTWRVQDYVYDAESGVLQARVHTEHGLESLVGKGKGMIAAWVHALSTWREQDVSVLHYDEHSLGQNTHSQAVAYVGCQFDGGAPVYAVAIEQDASKAALQAVLNAVVLQAPALKAAV